MKAVRFADFGPPEVLEVRDVPAPACPPGGVLVRVAAAGVNHLDLDERAGTSGFTINAEHQLGREGAGTVVETGPDADPGWLGARVIVSAYPPCGRCPACRRGLINVCHRPARPGIDVPGTYAEIVAAPVTGLFHLPDTVPFEVGACLQLGFGTAWHALFRRGDLRAGQTVLVTGAGGGVGSAAVRLAALAGAQVLAVAGSPERRALAAGLGAAHTAAPGDDLPAWVGDLTGDGADLVVDAGGGPFLATGLDCLRPGGRYVLYGAHGGERVDVDLIQVFRSYTSVVASRGWLLEDVDRVIEAAARGRITVPIQQSLPLDQAARAHQALADRTVAGKLVLRP
ncbi:alcohol dehydrogenase [Sphaerisporangium rufum]|uniref:Alcohol dehydrogenase n=1 Tax=Sphaerisporangium rufum TaxID=1381558 RepID=A0A919QXM1_9ACTN|nr:zinc-binding dehydrogenase [Sphaerisporangium rufum]GII75996.1 alcohol dehydrogenase [Sphaerisporangium rufum]